MTDFKISSITINTTKSFENNFESLKNLIKKSNSDFILAPELALTGYSYEEMESAYIFSKNAINKLKELSKNRAIIITIIDKDKNKFFNRLVVLHREKIIYTQDKSKLFTLNDENKFFSAGDFNKIVTTEINRVKVAFLICFELRFIDLWKKIQGADIIFIPAMWGEKRKEHFLTLSRALAVANQCYVATSNSKNMKNGSSIITPFGEVIKDDRKSSLEINATLKEIKKMRRYMNTGISL